LYAASPIVLLTTGGTRPGYRIRHAIDIRNLDCHF